MLKTTTLTLRGCQWLLCCLLLLGAVPLHAQLNGTYTIDPNSSAANNYKSFTLAAADLNTVGVSGPVVFKVANGTYNEQVRLGVIKGATAVRSVTFDGGDALKTILEYSATAQTTNYTLLLDNSKYIRVRNLTIRAKSTTWGWAVNVLGAAKNNAFAKCIVIADSVSTSTNVMGILINGSTTSYSTGGTADTILVDTCLVMGGYANYYNSSSNNVGQYIRGSYFKNGYQYGVYFSSGGEIKLFNNIVNFAKMRTTGCNAFYFINGSASGTRYHEIVGNQILNSGSYGMTFHTVHNPTNGTQGLIANNFVSNLKNTSQQYGVYMNLCAHWRVYHNTVVIDVPSTTNSSPTNTCWYLNSGSGKTDVRNNNFQVLGTKPTTTLPANFIAGTSGFQYLDYNNYYKESDTNFVMYLDINLYLNSYKGAYGFNKNSMSFKNNFVNLAAGDLHLTSNNPVMGGDPTVGILTDIDGDSRCKWGPTPGGDEMIYSSVNIKPDVFAPDTTTVGYPTSFVNKSTASIPVGYEWSYNGTILSTTKDQKFAFANVGMDSLKLTIRYCNGTVVYYKRIYVATPKRAPKADFLSDINATYTSGTVNFIDASGDGPASWTWDITPKTYNDPTLGTTAAFKFVNGTTANSQNPSVQFLGAGDYSVCLTADNVKGSNKKCKANYIKVYTGINMCGTTLITRNGSGYLFDQGGPTANYTANRTGTNKCTFKIQPCNASKVVLQFRNFDLRTGDYLRIFDGDKASDPPLYNLGNYIYGLTGMRSDATFPDSVVAKSGKMYIEFESDNNTTTVGPGFELFWTSVQGALTPPKAEIDMPDSVCENTVVGFKVKTPETDDLTYSWDLDDDKFEDSKKRETFFLYSGMDSVRISLTVTGCGGTDKVTKWLYFKHAKAKPAVDFDPAQYIVGVDEPVKINNKTIGCQESIEWTIYPNTFKYVNGTDDNSVDPYVSFSEPGLYTIILDAANQAGTGTKTKKDIVYVVKYCVPVIYNYNRDFGINRVMLKDLDNRSDVSSKGFQLFTDKTNPVLDRGGVFTLRMERTTNANNVNRAVWIDYNSDGDYTDAGELVATDTNSNTFFWDAQIAIDKTTPVGSYRMRVGSVTAAEIITPCGPHGYGEFEDYRIIIGDDRTAPVITLKGQDTVYVELGRTYKDAGATAFDNVDGDITFKMTTLNGVDIMEVGDNLVFYSVTDAAGNKTVKTRLVRILPDSTKPKGQFIGNDTVWVEVHSTYADSGVDASDNWDGKNLDIKTQTNLDMDKLGTYRYVYTVSDQTGNFFTLERTIVVFDSTKPAVAFTKGGKIKLAVHYPYIDNDLTIQDNYDSEFTVVKSGSFFAFKDNIPDSLGTFEAIYTVSDKSGNTTVYTRTIEVVDTIAPLLSLKGNLIVKLKRWQNYVEPGYIVTDNYDKKPVVTVKSDYVNSLMPGTFYVQYSAVDASGNKTVTLQRMIIIEESTGLAEQTQGDVKMVAYPNPTTGLVNLEVEMAQPAQTNLVVTDLYGREIKTLAAGTLQSGKQTYTVNLENQAAGIYLIRLQTGTQTFIQRISLVK